MLAPIHPLTGCVDLRVSLNGSHHCRSCNINLASSFYDLLQCGSHIALTLGKEPESVSVAIYTGAVCQTVFLGNGSRTPPRDEIGFDLCQLRVTTHRAVPFVPAQIWFLLTSLHKRWRTLRR